MKKKLTILLLFIQLIIIYEQQHQHLILVLLDLILTSIVERSSIETTQIQILTRLHQATVSKQYTNINRKSNMREE